MSLSFYQRFPIRFIKKEHSINPQRSSNPIIKKKKHMYMDGYIHYNNNTKYDDFSSHNTGLSMNIISDKKHTVSKENFKGLHLSLSNRTHFNELKIDQSKIKSVKISHGHSLSSVCNYMNQSQIKKNKCMIQHMLKERKYNQDEQKKIKQYNKEELTCRSPGKGIYSLFNKYVKLRPMNISLSNNHNKTDDLRKRDYDSLQIKNQYQINEILKRQRNETQQKSMITEKSIQCSINKPRRIFSNPNNKALYLQTKHTVSPSRTNDYYRDKVILLALTKANEPEMKNLIISYSPELKKII